MCGIAGVLGRPGEAVQRTVLERMNARLAHRGPDDECYCFNHHAALAQRREDGLGSNHNARLFLGMLKNAVPLLPGTPAVEVVPEIGVEPTDLQLWRYHGLGPMGGTDLDAVLRNVGVTTIVGVGVSVNVAIPNFAMDAVNAGYQFVLPRDAVAGIPEDYAAMFEAQAQGCAICHAPEPEGQSLHVDHDHDTGDVRGLLCFTCNAGIGMFAHDIELLSAAVVYLRR